MQLVIHAGAHLTESERMLACLLRNRDLFASKGVAVPEPDRYRGLLRKAFNSMQTGEAPPQTRRALEAAVVGDPPAQRILLSNENFFGLPRFAVRDSDFYPLAAERVTYLQKLFPEAQIELFFCLRNPAAFLSLLHQQVQRKVVADRLSAVAPADLRWPDLLTGLVNAAPGMPITVWCYEDAPFVWGRVLRAMAGVDASTEVSGAFDLLGDIMTAEGVKRFEAEIAPQKGLSEDAIRQAIEDLSAQFALEDQLMEELDMPGLTLQAVAEASARYEADVSEIGRMHGIRLIAP